MKPLGRRYGSKAIQFHLGVAADSIFYFVFNEKLECLEDRRAKTQSFIFN